MSSTSSSSFCIDISLVSILFASGSFFARVEAIANQFINVFLNFLNWKTILPESNGSLINATSFLRPIIAHDKKRNFLIRFESTMSPAKSF